LLPALAAQRRFRQATGANQRRQIASKPYFVPVICFEKITLRWKESPSPVKQLHRRNIFRRQTSSQQKEMAQPDALFGR
jgi:hypothetical protein